MIQFNFNGQNIQMEKDPNTMLLEEIYNLCSKRKCENCEAKSNGIVKDYGVIVCENSDICKRNENGTEV